jgi:hypothetical protein
MFESLSADEKRQWVAFINALLKQRYKEIFENGQFSLSDLEEMEGVLDEKFARCEEAERARRDLEFQGVLMG